jgi:hypothetical protein
MQSLWRYLAGWYGAMPLWQHISGKGCTSGNSRKINIEKVGRKLCPATLGDGYGLEDVINIIVRTSSTGCQNRRNQKDLQMDESRNPKQCRIHQAA